MDFNGGGIAEMLIIFMLIFNKLSHWVGGWLWKYCKINVHTIGKKYFKAAASRFLENTATLML